MNPVKCEFGATLGKFIGSIIEHKGIDIDYAKVRAIQDMPRPRNLQEL